MIATTDDTTNQTTTTTCVVSGYFDPLHVGHLEYFKNAKSVGDRLVVIVNNDRQASLKKGKPFMPEDERVMIVKELRCVDDVVLSIDEDRTVIKTIEEVAKRNTITYFCNGGDQTNCIIPEKDVCERLGIELIDGLGLKIQSSSWLLSSV